MTPAPIDPHWAQYLRWLYGFHSLSVKQKLLTMAQRYAVEDPEGRRFFVVRPPKMALRFLAGAVGFILYLMALFLAYPYFRDGEMLPFFAILFVATYVARLVVTLLAPYRDIIVYADEQESLPLMYMSQDNKFGLTQRFTIYDLSGQPVAVARRLVVWALVQRRWQAVTLDGRLILRLQEDSLLLAALRRYLGTLWGLLRTNFDILLPDGTRIGEYNRKLTLTDQYVLTLDQDPHFLVDRRVVLALAILLDTGEGR